MDIFTGQSLLVILVVGIVAGWLAGTLVRGSGFGLIGDLIRTRASEHICDLRSHTSSCSRSGTVAFVR
jgi:hypothetical protein